MPAKTQTFAARARRIMIDRLAVGPRMQPKKTKKIQNWQRFVYTTIDYGQQSD